MLRIILTQKSSVSKKYHYFLCKYIKRIQCWFEFEPRSIIRIFLSFTRMSKYILLKNKRMNQVGKALGTCNFHNHYKLDTFLSSKTFSRKFWNNWIPWPSHYVDNAAIREWSNKVACICGEPLHFKSSGLGKKMLAKHNFGLLYFRSPIIYVK